MKITRLPLSWLLVWPLWLQALVCLLRGKKSERSITCGHLKVSRKGFEVSTFFLTSCTCCVERIHGTFPSFQRPKAKWAAVRWPPRSQNLGFPKFDVMRLGILARMANLLSFLCVFLLFLPGTTFTEYGKILFFEESCKTLSCFWKVLIGKMIVRISRCLYHARGSHQSLRTSTVYITAFWMEKVKTFYRLPFHWCHYLFKMLCSKFSS